MEKTAKSSTDLCNRGVSWKHVLLGGGISGGGKAGAGPSSGLKRSVPSASVPEPTTLPASSAPTENPPPPEQVSPSPEHPKAADCSQKSNVAVGNEIKSLGKKPFTEVSAPVVDESTWPALGQLPEKPPSIPKRPARGVSVVRKASKASDASTSRETAPKNTPDVLEPSSSETKLEAGDPLVVIDHPTERGSSSGGPNPASDQSKRRGSSRGGNSSRNARRNGSNRRGSRRDNIITPAAPTVPSARGTHVPLPMRPQGMGRGYVRSTPFGNLPFMAPPPPVRPLDGAPFMHFIPTFPAGYYPGMSFRHMPPPVRPPAIHHPALLHGNNIRAAIVQQIDYYFSKANLIKDEFLRSKMDDEGWVPVSLIASFPRVRRLTGSIPLILDSLRASYVVEVQNNKIRKRHGWRQWLMHGLPRSSCSSRRWIM